MNNATMLYRCPGLVDCGGVMCETTIVEDTDVDAHVAAGWHTHFLDAKAAHDADAAKLAANEEEQRAIEAQLAAADGAAPKAKGRGKHAAG